MTRHRYTLQNCLQRRLGAAVPELQLPSERIEQQVQCSLNCQGMHSIEHQGKRSIMCRYKHACMNMQHAPTGVCKTHHLRFWGSLPSSQM